MSEQKPSDLTIGRNLKIGIFHLGSGMADVLATGVWNRIMVADLGYSATVVGLLTGLRYFLAPLGVWAGRYSDTHVIGGFRRLFWIWLGRAMMVLSTLSLGFSTAEMVHSAQSDPPLPPSPALWLVIALSFLLFSLGIALSGSTFLALVHDRAAPAQRGRAVGLVWTFLLLGFTIGGIFFSVMLPHHEGAGEIAFSAASLQNLFLITSSLLAAIWLFSLLGEEKRNGKRNLKRSVESSSLLRDLALVWRSRPMRLFLIYLILSMMFAFLQDTVLEPFAGQVFGMEAQVTNRFSAYWGSMAILGSFGFLYLSRRHRKLTNGLMSLAGVWVLVAAYLLFAVSSLGEIRALVTPGLVLLGLGLGIWNIGTLGLMMDLSPDGRAGTFLGFWTLTVTFARGFGVAGGGILRDLALQLSGDHTVAYGTVFIAGCLGLTFALLALRRADLRDFALGRLEPEVMFAGALD
ncbi:MAG: BCD family MFS transporter [Chloroflexi bacterium]|nr:BCD family MFS transporter [Chloroflexota bacterium]